MMKPKHAASLLTVIALGLAAGLLLLGAHYAAGRASAAAPATFIAPFTTGSLDGGCTSYCGPRRGIDGVPGTAAVTPRPQLSRAARAGLPAYPRPADDTAPAAHVVAPLDPPPNLSAA